MCVSSSPVVVDTGFGDAAVSVTEYDVDRLVSCGGLR